MRPSDILSGITDAEVRRAMAAESKGIGNARSDETRPVYHFRAPAQWMNDPNGTIYHAGYYHLFYQHNPYSDTWSTMHWGHTRSRDLVHWEHLPIALCPSQDLGEGNCFSGSAWVDKKGLPMIMYTKVSEKPEKYPHEQWVAHGDEDMLVWHKDKDNPILSVDAHDGPLVKGDWRDPFLFSCEGRTFLILGAAMEDSDDTGSVVLLYEAADDTLKRFHFRNTIARRSVCDPSFFECPNFFEIGGKWVLISSPYTCVEYVVGEFEAESGSFTPEGKGIIDESIDFYATNIFNHAPGGRIIMVGWIRGFKKGRGWNGCTSLPRELSLDADGRLLQRPVPETTMLRGSGCEIGGRVFSPGRHVIEGVEGDTMELMCRFRGREAVTYGLCVRTDAFGYGGIEIVCDGRYLRIDELLVPIDWKRKGTSMEFHLFLDRSVMELFIDDGYKCVTKTIYPPLENRHVAITSSGGVLDLESFRMWRMRSVWDEHESELFFT